MRHTWLGTFDYVIALELQQHVQQNAEDDPAILGLEHPLTITLGRRGDPLKDVLVGFKTLREKAIPVVAVDRGGQATLHNQGQLVIYPILSLRKMQIGAKVYVGILEKATKQLLKNYGVEACCRGDEPGLYTEKGKIAAFGVRINRGITSHGVAINVHNDLSEFAMIRSCGKAAESFSSLADFGVDASLEKLFFEWVEIFQRLLGAENLTHLAAQARLSQNNLERV